MYNEIFHMTRLQALIADFRKLLTMYSMVICSVPLSKAGAEPKGCLHTALSLPGEMVIPEQLAAPPVRVPKGLRSNRLRKQASSLSSSLGVIKSAATAKATSQGDYIKVSSIMECIITQL